MTTGQEILEKDSADQRYDKVIEAIRSLGTKGNELAMELDEIVGERLGRYRDAGVADAMGQDILPMAIQALAIEIEDLKLGMMVTSAFGAGAMGLGEDSLASTGSDDLDKIRRGAFARGDEIRDAAGTDFCGMSLEESAEEFDTEIQS
jgi:hypothetical protein